METFAFAIIEVLLGVRFSLSLVENDMSITGTAIFDPSRMKYSKIFRQKLK